MRNSAKLYANNMTGPFTAILTSRCSIIKDYKNNTFTLVPIPKAKTWGVRFEVRNGYTTKLSSSDLGISPGTINGNPAWVSVLTRPLTLDYTFYVNKQGKLFDTYRVISEV